MGSISWTSGETRCSDSETQHTQTMITLLILITLRASSPHWTSAGSRQPLNTLNYLSDQQSSDGESLVREFHGNSSHTDHFKLLREDGTSVLVGARNIIYNLSLPDLVEYTDQLKYWPDSHVFTINICCPSSSPSTG